MWSADDAAGAKVVEGGTPDPAGEDTYHGTDNDGEVRHRDAPVAPDPVVEVALSLDESRAVEAATAAGMMT